MKHEEKIEHMLKELEGRIGRIDKLAKDGLPKHVDREKLEKAYESMRQYSLRFARKK